MTESTNSFRKPRNYSPRWILIGRGWYALRAPWRWARVSRFATRLLGPQYRRSRDLIEIDITYLCNLHCLNCNRSVRQAREAMHIELDAIRSFVDQSLERQKRWNRIRVLGGEPTLHPQFMEIIAELERYRAWYPACLIEVVTNGYGDRVEAQLAKLPKHIWIDNSRKRDEVQTGFRPFNEAPIDDRRYRHADFANGCAIMHDCGMGLTPLGYYPCAVAGGIERITGREHGQDRLPDDADDMQGAARALCRLCGRFQDGHYVPKNLREPLEEERISPTWQRLYAQWHAARQGLQVEDGVALTHEGAPVAAERPEARTGAPG